MGKFLQDLYPGVRMAEEDVLIILLVISNLFSAYYTAFCIEASTKRYHWFYTGLHRNDLNWYATWYSCQTIALLVSITNALFIYAAGARLRGCALKYISEKDNGHSTEPELDSNDRVMEKEQETEMIQGQAFTTLWSSSMPQQNYNYYSRSKQHILPVYNDCPFTTSSARRLLFHCSRQIKAWGRGISAQKIVRWTASLAVLAGVVAAVWNVGFVPFWITLVQVNRQDKVVMIPWNYTK